MKLLKNTRIEYHILQSFPVTCLNRDDVGAPKTAVVGGVTRARVSSQSWKRQVRLSLHEFGGHLGKRTKKLESILKSNLIEAGASAEQADACSSKIAGHLADDTLIFITDSEASAFVDYVKGLNYEKDKIKEKELGKIAKKHLNLAVDGLDVALFGRMVAKAVDMNIHAAASFSHAISTHAVENEIEFFTALDDLANEQGSAHMGSLEFNSATYYRYISLDLGQLAQNLGTEDGEVEIDILRHAISEFTKALFVAVPSARQTTQSGASPWDFAKVLVRQGHALQVPFDAPVKSKGMGYATPSVDFLKEYLRKKEKLTGSLFCKLGDYEWGENENYSIDSLILDLQKHLE